MLIKQPHGYLLDADGKVVMRFGAWPTGNHTVPDAVESVEYVKGASAHTKTVDDKYAPDW